MSSAIHCAELPRGNIAAAPELDARAFARVEVHDDLQMARAAYEEILSRGAVASPYQGYEFTKHWLHTIGASRGIAPMIVIARDETGAIGALLPLGRFRYGPVSCASFLGGRMANYHMGLFAPDFAWDRRQIEALLRQAVAQTQPRIDVFTLVSQPVCWRGVVNPLGSLARQASPSFAYSSALPRDFAAWRDAHFSKSTQKKLRKKAKRLETLGPLRHLRAASAGEARLLLDTFLAQKRARAAEQKHGAEFADEPTIDLLRRLSAFPEVGAPALELHGLCAGDRIVAVFGGLLLGGRLSGAFLSHDRNPEVAASSPGELLILEIARDAVERRLDAIDFGVGEARYKSGICEVTEPLFDAAFSVSTIGRLAASSFLIARGMKRRIKQSPHLYALAHSARRWLG